MLVISITFLNFTKNTGHDSDSSYTHELSLPDSSEKEQPKEWQIIELQNTLEKIDSSDYQPSESINFDVVLNLHNHLSFLGSKVAPKFYPDPIELDNSELFKLDVPGDKIFAPCRDEKKLVGKLKDQKVHFPFDKDSLSFSVDDNGSIFTDFKFSGEVYSSHFHLFWNKNNSRPSNCREKNYEDAYSINDISLNLDFGAELHHRYSLTKQKKLKTLQSVVEIYNFNSPNFEEHSNILDYTLERFLSVVISIANVIDRVWEIIQAVFNFGDGEGLFPDLDCNNLTKCAEKIINENLQKIETNAENELRSLINESLSNTLNIGGSYRSDFLSIDYSAYMDSFKTSSEGGLINSLFSLSITPETLSSGCSKYLNRPSLTSGEVDNPYNGDISIEFELDLINQLIYLFGKAGLFCADFSIPTSDLFESRLLLKDEIELSLHPKGEYSVDFDESDNTLSIIIPMTITSSDDEIDSDLTASLFLSFELKNDCNNGISLLNPTVRIANLEGSFIINLLDSSIEIGTDSIKKGKIIDKIDTRIAKKINDNMSEGGINLIPRVTNLGEKDLYLELVDTIFDNNVIINSFEFVSNAPEECTSNQNTSGGGGGGGGINSLPNEYRLINNLDNEDGENDIEANLEVQEALSK